MEGFEQLGEIMKLGATQGMMQQGVAAYDAVAAVALSNLMSSNPELGYEQVATLAWKYADAMMVERKKRVGGES